MNGNATDRPELPMGQEEGFVTRWSQRKQAAKTAGPAPTLPPETDEAREMPCLTDADMLPVGELKPESDYSGFLSPGVSAELQQLALRKLFRSGGFDLCDGLDDYDEDFSSFTKLAGIVTAEMKHRVQQALQREPDAAGTAAHRPPVVEQEPLAGQPVVTGSSRREDGHPGKGEKDAEE